MILREKLNRYAGKAVVRTTKRLYDEAKEDDVTGAAAELAFRFFLAIFPFFIFLAALGAFIADRTGVNDPTQEIMNVLGDSLPADTASVLRGELDTVVHTRDAKLLSLGVAGALWAAAGGVGTIVKASNRAYGVRETRAWLKRVLLALVLTILGGLLLVAAFILFVVGQIYGLKLAEEVGLEGAAARLLAFARWPAVMVLSLTSTAVVYWSTPNLKLPFRWITPGALLFSVGWLAVTYCFSLYVSHFGSFNATYGTLGGVVITLTWFYLTSLILLLGQELNAVLAQQAGAVSEPVEAVARDTPADLPQAGAAHNA